MQVPIYVHAKEVLTPDGKREAIELNYMTFLAYNGWYKLFDRIYLGKIGAHDADWVGELFPWVVRWSHICGHSLVQAHGTEYLAALCTVQLVL